MTAKDIIKELSISVACLLDDTIYAEELVADIEHIQNLVTKLENIIERKSDE